MMNHTFNINKKQEGMATLVFSLVILFTLTIATIFGARVGLLNEKMASNDYRNKESFMAAQTGIDAIVAALSSNFKLLCTTGTCKLTDPAYTLSGTVSNDASDTSGVVRSWTGSATVTQADPVIINVAVSGTVAKTTGGTTVTESTSTITEKLGKASSLAPRPAAPLIMTSSIKVTGTMDIVGRTEGGDCGSLTKLTGASTTCGTITVWNPDPVVLSGTFDTCIMQSFIAVDGDPVYTLESGKPLCNISHPSCQCKDGQTIGLGGLSGKAQDAAPDAVYITGTLGPDIVAPPVVTVTPGVNYPDDLFKYVFGVPKSSWATVKNDAKTIRLTSCASFNSATPTALYWVTGNCDIPDAGFIDNPIVLVVENGILTVNGGPQVYGLAYVFNSSGSTGKLKATSGYWYGGIIDDSGNGPTAGNFALIYSDTVFDVLSNSTAFTVIAAVPGTWRDW